MSSKDSTIEGEDEGKNITWHEHIVGRKDRWKAKSGGHSGAVLWFTGLSACGKSSVANQVDLCLHQMGIRTYVLDGDNVRHGLCSDLGFSLEDRTENIRRVDEVSKLMADSGSVVLAAFISPYRADRDKIRSIMEGVAPFVEIHVEASIDKCESRDPKGLYKLAREGKIKGFTGIDDPYEEPLEAEITLDSNSKSILQLAEDVITWLETHHTLEVP